MTSWYYLASHVDHTFLAYCSPTIIYSLFLDLFYIYSFLLSYSGDILWYCATTNMQLAAYFSMTFTKLNLAM